MDVVAAQEFSARAKPVSPDAAHLLWTPDKWMNCPRQGVIKLPLTGTNEHLLITLGFVSFSFTISFDSISYEHDLVCVNLRCNLAMKYFKSSWSSLHLVWFKNYLYIYIYIWEQFNMENVIEQSFSLSSFGTALTTFPHLIFSFSGRSHLHWFYKELLQWRQGCLHHVNCWPFRHHASYHSRDIKDVTCQWEGQVLLSSNRVICFIWTIIFQWFVKKKAPTVTGLSSPLLVSALFLGCLTKSLSY